MSRPFLKWAGGKHKLVPFIAHHLPPQPRKRLIEPFAGSAALSLALDFDAYVLNDTNADVIALFQAIKQEGQPFIEYARSFFVAENNQKKRFYELREQFNDSQNPTERAALFIYLNRHAFNGLCRYNSKGEFNVPFGRYRMPYFPEKEMQAFLDKSSRIALMQGDFQTAMLAAGRDDVIYCDPPYVPLSETASFTAYAKGGFGWDDQTCLAALAKQVAPHAQGVLISNHDTDWTRQLYQDARLATIAVQRHIAAQGSSRHPVGELLAMYGY